MIAETLGYGMGTVIAVAAVYFVLAAPLNIIGIYDPPKRAGPHNKTTLQASVIFMSYTVWVAISALVVLFAIGSIVRAIISL